MYRPLLAFTLLACSGGALAERLYTVVGPDGVTLRRGSLEVRWLEAAPGLRFAAATVPLTVDGREQAALIDVVAAMDDGAPAKLWGPSSSARGTTLARLSERGTIETLWQSEAAVENRFVATRYQLRLADLDDDGRYELALTVQTLDDTGIHPLPTRVWRWTGETFDPAPALVERLPAPLAVYSLWPSGSPSTPAGPVSEPADAIARAVGLAHVAPRLAVPTVAVPIADVTVGDDLAYLALAATRAPAPAGRIVLAIVRANAPVPRVLASLALVESGSEPRCPSFGTYRKELRSLDWSPDGRVRALAVEWSTGGTQIFGAVVRWDGVTLGPRLGPIALGTCLDRRRLEVSPTSESGAPHVRVVVAPGAASEDGF